MKIRPEHYQRLKDEIRAMLERKELTIGEVIVEQTARGHSYKRVRWDLLWASNVRIVQSHNAYDARDLPLYDYLNDDHIDTALGRIVKELNAEEVAADG